MSVNLRKKEVLKDRGSSSHNCKILNNSVINKKYFLIILVLLIINIVSASPLISKIYNITGEESNSAWFRTETYRPPNLLNESFSDDFNLVWSYLTNGSIKKGLGYYSYALYAGSSDGYVYSLNYSDGKLNWKYKTNGSVETTPYTYATYSDGVYKYYVFFGSDDGNVYALNSSSGEQIWSYQTGGAVKSSPLFLNNIIYVGSDDGKVYALNSSSGEQIWNYTTGGSVRSSPIISYSFISYEYTIYVGSDDGRVYALNYSSGEQIWNYTTDGSVKSTPVFFDNIIYVGSDDGRVYALNLSNGGQIWNYTTGGSVKSSPKVNKNIIYFGSDDGKVYALNISDGEQIWNYSTGGSVRGSAVFAKGSVYIGSNDGKIYALDVYDGIKRNEYFVGSGIEGSLLSYNYALHFGSDDGRVYNVKLPDWFNYAPEEYDLIENPDKNFVKYSDSSYYDSSYFRFNITEDIYEVVEMDFYFKGYSDVDLTNIYVYNTRTLRWDFLEDVEKDGDFFRFSLRKDSVDDSVFRDYVSDGYLWIIAQSRATAGGSCPFVYSFDGEKYWFDHEGFAFATMSISETSSFGRLEHLKAVDGEYKVRIGERLDETSWINNFKLKVVDHKGDGAVVPDVKGNPHTINEKISPNKCFSKEGLDCLNEIRDLDFNFWKSDKYSEEYDWIEIEFDNSEMVESGKLLIYFQGAELLKDKWKYYIDLIGGNNWDLLQKVMEVPVLKDMFLENLGRNKLMIQIWDGEKWKDLENIASGRERMSESLLVVEDIEDKVRIRLKHKTGNYEIDAVYMDFSEDEEIKITELSPLSAVKDYKSFIEEVSADDGKYVSLEKGDNLDLIYKEIPEYEDWNRDFFVEIKGYYNYDIMKNKSKSELLGGIKIWFESYFDESYTPEIDEHHTLYIDYLDVNVSHLEGDAGINEVFASTLEGSYAKEETFEMTCGVDSGGGANVGMYFQFKSNGTWYNIPELKDNEALDLEEKSSKVSYYELIERIKSTPKISEDELKENKNPELEKEWVRIYPEDEGQLGFAFSMDLDVLDYQKDYVDAVATTKEIEKLREENISVEILAFDKGDVFSDFDDYHSYDEVVADMIAIEGNYSDIAKMYEIGKSVENRSIWAMKISDEVEIDEEEPEIFIVGNHHAREVMTVEIPLYEIHYLVENYENDYIVGNLVDKREIWIVPTMNPDGLVYVETNDSMWRKNRRDNNGSFGVDLNRNYGYKWGYDNSGSSPTPSSETYRGVSAFSEPETQAVRDFIQGHNITYALSYHSYGEYLLYPWGYVNSHTPDHEKFLELSEGMLEELDWYSSGTPGELLYLVNGDFDDWSYGEQGSKNKIFGMTFEVNNGAEGFRPSPSEIIPTCKEHISAFLYFLEEAGLEIKRAVEIDENKVIDIIDNQTYVSSVVVHEDGEYELRCLGFNVSDSVPSKIANINILTPMINVEIVEPVEEAVKEDIFNFVVNVSCSDFNCGKVFVYLDPQGEIEKKYSFKKPEIEKIDDYDYVMMGGLNHLAEPGYPVLPFKTVKILLPYEEEISEIKVEASNKEYIGKDYYCKPGDSYVPLCDSEEIFEIKEPNPEIYNSETAYPEKVYSDYQIEKFRGYKIFLMNLYPVEYVPKSGELYYYQDINVKIKTKSSNNLKKSLKRNLRGLEKDKQSVLDVVDNMEMVLSYDVPVSGFGTNSDGESYDYVIITSNEFKDSNFSLLVDEKNSRGVKTIIVSVEDIVANYSGNDKQDKVRNFIIDAYQNWGIEYVLLGGDRTIIPARKLWANAEGITDQIPADLYYAALDGDWNSDGDSNYGEVGEEDWFAEVYVGRATVRNKQDIANFVRKTLDYKNNYGEDAKDILMVGENLWSDNCYHLAEPGDPPAPRGNYGGYYLNELVDFRNINNISSQGYQSDYYNIDRLYDGYRVRDSESSWATSELKDKMNQGVNMLNHLGHGAPTSAMKMGFSDIDSLTNDDYFIAFSQSCSSGRFDDQECMAQRFTVAEHGAVAYIGNSRYGWGIRGVYDGGTCPTNGPDQRQHRFFINSLTGDNIHILGEAYQISKHEDVDYILTGPDCDGAWPCRGVQRWVSFSHNLFGDPELRIHLRGISIEKLYLEPSPIGLDGVGKCIAEVIQYNPSANITSVNFSVINSNDEKIIDNVEGVKINDTFWESEEFVADLEGVWQCVVEVVDTEESYVNKKHIFFPGEEKGLITNITGDEPFYTLDVNPQSCNLNEDESCLINWRVVPTGQVNTSWKFFAYVNSPFLEYLTGVSEKISIKIIDGGSGEPEDINGDGIIDIQDLVAVALYIGSSGCGEPDWCNRRDINKDGGVDIQDLVRVALKI